MIYTVTFNPSLDYIITIKDSAPGNSTSGNCAPGSSTVDNCAPGSSKVGNCAPGTSAQVGFALGKTNRTASEQLLPGGKGINVSTVLHNLGVESIALGFIAGFTGEEIDRKLSEMGICREFIRVEEGFSRINIKLKDYDGTEINGQGPLISEEAVEQLLTRLDTLKAGDTLVLAGSIPGCIPDSIYRDILARLSDKGIAFVVDAAGELLLQVLEYRPFLIKPNHHELGEIFGVSLQTKEAVIPYAVKLQEKGARNVLVSMSGQGAVFIEESGKVYELPVPAGQLVNAVGAGDSMVAGFLAGWLEKQDFYHAFKMAVAAGSASAFSEFLATGEEIRRLYASMR